MVRQRVCASAETHANRMCLSLVVRSAGDVRRLTVVRYRTLCRPCPCVSHCTLTSAIGPGWTTLVEPLSPAGPVTCRRDGMVPGVGGAACGPSAAARVHCCIRVRCSPTVSHALWRSSHAREIAVSVSWPRARRGFTHTDTRTRDRGPCRHRPDEQADRRAPVHLAPHGRRAAVPDLPRARYRVPDSPPPGTCSVRGGGQAFLARHPSGPWGRRQGAVLWLPGPQAAPALWCRLPMNREERPSPQVQEPGDGDVQGPAEPVGEVDPRVGEFGVLLGLGDGR